MKKKIRRIKYSWRLLRKALKFSYLMLSSYEFRRSLAYTLREAKKITNGKTPEFNKTIVREFFVIYGDISCITPKGLLKAKKKK